MTDYSQFTDGKKMGLQDDNGLVVIPAQYDFIALPCEEVCAIQIGEKRGYVDLANKPLFPFVDDVEYFGDFSEGLAAFSRGIRYGYIDKTGQQVIAPAFHYAGPFISGVAVVRNEKGLCGLINNQGTLVVDYKYEHLVAVTGWPFMIFSTEAIGKYGLMDVSGNEILPPDYEYITVREGKKICVGVRLDNGDLREGDLDVATKNITWNNNQDKYNEQRRRYLAMEQALKDGVNKLFQAACPCRYPRFRHLVELNTTRVRCLDGEILFAHAKDRFKRLSSPDERLVLYECPECGAKFSLEWIEVHAYFQIEATKVVLEPKKPDVGTPVKEPVPLCFGFQHLETDPPPSGKFSYVEAPEVVRYLTEVSK